MTHDRETAQEIFRARVLAAMDTAATEIFGPQPTNCPGATDADLPSVFPTLDKHLDRLAARYGHNLRD